MECSVRGPLVSPSALDGSPPSGHDHYRAFVVRHRRRRRYGRTCGRAEVPDAGFVRQTWSSKTDAKDGYADHTCHRDAQPVERHRRRDLARTGRRERHDDRHRGEARRPSAARAAAPGVLRLPLRRARAGCCSSGARWASTTPPASGRTPAAATPTPARRPSRRPPGGRTRSSGSRPSLLAEAGTVRYNHPDPDSGLVEQEYNHLFVGLVQAPLRPDPEEVGETAFVTAGGAGGAARRRTPFSAWFMTVLDAARPGDPGADGPVRPAGDVGAPAAARGTARGLERQGGPDHLAAARGVLDVARPRPPPG